MSSQVVADNLSGAACQCALQQKLPGCLLQQARVRAPRQELRELLVNAQELLGYIGTTVNAQQFESWQSCQEHTAPYIQKLSVCVLLLYVKNCVVSWWCVSGTGLKRTLATAAKLRQSSHESQSSEHGTALNSAVSLSEAVCVCADADQGFDDPGPRSAAADRARDGRVGQNRVRL